MNKDQNKVVHLHQRDPQSALERLNRITGLQFSSWPESLLPSVQGAHDEQDKSTAESHDEQACRQLG
ncbi:hypothetical protein [Pseudomonas citronellolis]|uniref:hypothetical protein n=1 Tax=Pseudomonas citronellolis TaxID=53408 RepID=UPI003D339AC7